MLFSWFSLESKFWGKGEIKLATSSLSVFFFLLCACVCSDEEIKQEEINGQRKEFI